MSAFIISPKTMTEVINGLALTADTHIELDGKRYKRSANDFTKLGRHLYRMNRLAIGDRYNDSALPDMDPDNLHETYSYAAVGTVAAPSREQALKSMNCLLYQCNEGDLPQCSLYKALKHKAGELAQLIVTDIDAYKQATWD